MASIEMELQSLYKMKSGFVAREVGNELILVPLTGNVAQMNALFTLNDTAKFIWENINENNSSADLVNLMTEEFSIDRETAEKDIKLFLDKLATTLDTKRL
jgi:hypothetical protein